jgi:hypothetical protein
VVPSMLGMIGLTRRVCCLVHSEDFVALGALLFHGVSGLALPLPTTQNG